jgi:hypothetical protein
MKTKDNLLVFEDWIASASTKTIPRNNAKIKVKVCDHKKAQIYPPVSIMIY